MELKNAEAYLSDKLDIIGEELKVIVKLRRKRLMYTIASVIITQALVSLLVMLFVVWKLNPFFERERQFYIELETLFERAAK